MSRPTVAIALACYNEATYVERCLLSCLAQQGNLRICVADDGSTDDTAARVGALQQAYPCLELVTLPHGERGLARRAAIARALTHDPDFLLWLDADMQLPPGLVATCLATMERQNLEALVIPERSFSQDRGYWTQVKVFERNIINSGRHTAPDMTAFEGARLWRTEAFLRSGGFHPDQVAFEDIQPMLRFLAAGGRVGRIPDAHILHDEKRVTLRALLDKKAYYFRHTHTVLETEVHSPRHLLRRWYFFRKALYRPASIGRYLRQPHLAAGMALMYLLLTLLALRVQWVRLRTGPDW